MHKKYCEFSLIPHKNFSTVWEVEEAEVTILFFYFQSLFLNLNYSEEKLKTFFCLTSKDKAHRDSSL